IKATVLEANRTAWGCSVRNGGQAQCASGRLKRSQWITRYGLEAALGLHRECVDGMENFKELIKDIDCDPQPGGHLYVAHRARVMPTLEKEAKLLRDVFKYDARMLDADTVKREWIGDEEACGAMHEPEGIGIHAGKLAFGYLKKARALGATVHPASPVQGWETRNGVHYLKTPGGIVRARAVGVCTGGYTSNSLHPELKNRLLPILSNSIVTRPLTAQEIEACGLRTHQVITDTRVLRHYYRLMPDNRLQIGSRSAITGNDAPQKQYEQRLIEDMWRKFPALRGIQIDYSWWGWVDVSHDMMPRIHQPDPKETIYYSLGYGGNGVMYSAQAGRRLAQWIAGKGNELTLPIFTSRLPFPNVRELVVSEAFAPFRRFGQRFLYRWYAYNDERP
ncbi:MAG: FAD-binding oxidoreductase, partial [Azoarcus sp.]|nr:FAD-binding oxidoreductase [Azoarcus sp.]